MSIIRRRVRVTGVVQGVGFRPYIYAAAFRGGLSGFVENDSQGVLIEVEGRADAVREFLDRLQGDPPPLAKVEELVVSEILPSGTNGFAILESHPIAGESTPVPADIATCDDCLAELFDPANRRYRYPFLNCTNCGPRFTIIRALPYDRPLTTMAAFKMCADCEREYYAPRDRRFHAQPTACPQCGPQLLLKPGGEQGEAALLLAQEILATGKILAIKGIGGFHLACDALNDSAVLELRRRKGRGDKPFAVMARSVDVVRDFAEVKSDDANLLLGRERPIVLLERAQGRKLSEFVAPGQKQLGFFLPYSPLHHLLLGEKLLVMTSGNRADEPICRTNAEALERLSGLADAFLLHDRDIHVVCDDSVVRSEVPIRRSRGYTPLPVRLKFRGPIVLGVGAELKATFCLTKGERAYLSQHIGDMENIETLQAYERALEQMLRLFDVKLDAVACDMHPGYLSSRWAKEFAANHNLPLLAVQHHHAHAASLMAENNLSDAERIIAIVFDGTGYGTDGTIWGGEVLIAGYESFERVGHMKYIALPGGDGAVRKPYRAALSHLQAAGIGWDSSLACVTVCDAAERQILQRQIAGSVNAPKTSSMGRLFDAAASLLGICQEATYEAQGAMQLEAMAEECDDATGALFSFSSELPFVFDPKALWEDLVRELMKGTPPSRLAFRVHHAVAGLIETCAQKERARTGLNRVGLTGGVFQNLLLVRLATRRLLQDGFEVLTHRLAPPNDGGLALGQAVVALKKSTLR